MDMEILEAVRALARRAGWTVHRWPSNRFDAMDDMLRLLAGWGFRPQVVVDIGANRGTWTDMAVRHFDAREFHLVEPQPGCHPTLERFQPPTFHLHKVALSSAGQPSVLMVGTSAESSNTGAWVASAGTAGAVALPATSLDELLGDRLQRSDRPLMKLDVECHELTVLQSGRRVLQAAEVVISEVQLFEINDNGQPVLLDLMTFMASEGFGLYDVAALSGRTRDQRLRRADVTFVRADSPLAADRRWA